MEDDERASACWGGEGPKDFVVLGHVRTLTGRIEV